jgi:hypothetical protein
MWKREGNM